MGRRISPNHSLPSSSLFFGNCAQFVTNLRGSHTIARKNSPCSLLALFCSAVRLCYIRGGFAALHLRNIVAPLPPFGGRRSLFRHAPLALLLPPAAGGRGSLNANTRRARSNLLIQHNKKHPEWGAFCYGGEGENQKVGKRASFCVIFGVKTHIFCVMWGHLSRNMLICDNAFQFFVPNL